MNPPAGLGTARGLAPNRWTWLAYGFALVLAAWVAFFVARMPLQVSDNIGNMLKLRHSSLWEITAAYFEGGPFLRPFLWSTFKVFFDLGTVLGGKYHLVFRSVQVLQVAALLLLVTRLFGVRSARDFQIATVGLSILVGYHTFSGFVNEAYPINSFLSIAICCVAALNLAESRGGKLVDLAAVLVLVYAMLTIESGLLVWVVIITARLAGARGVSTIGIAGTCLAVAGYFLLRFGVFEGATPGLDERSTGYWTRSVEPEELVERFGGDPLPFYLYNVMSSFVSLIVSDPRFGLWDTLRLRQEGEPLPAWLRINLFTTLAISVPMVLLTLRRLLDWVRLRVAPEERGVVVFWVLAVANSVISYAYTKDQIISPAGTLFALGGYVTLRWLIECERSWPRLLRPALAVFLLCASLGWTVRTFGLAYQLTHSAQRARDDWTEIDQWIADQGMDTTRPGDADFVRRIGNQSISSNVPNPVLLYGRKARFFDQKN